MPTKDRGEENVIVQQVFQRMSSRAALTLSEVTLPEPAGGVITTRPGVKSVRGAGLVAAG